MSKGRLDLVHRFPRFPFPPSTPNVPGSNRNRKWNICHMTSFYISSFIKIRSPIHEINIPHFSRFPLPPAPPNIVELEKRLLSSQFVQVSDTPTNFHRPSMSRSTELANALEIPPPPTPPN